MAELTLDELMLEKVDILRNRCRISYREAYDVLERHQGNVVQALIEMEEREQGESMVEKIMERVPQVFEERMSVMGHELLGKVQQIVRTGQTSKIRVMRDGRTLVSIPTAVGAVGAILFPYLAVVATAATVAARYELVLDKRPQAQATGQARGQEDSDTGHEPGVVNVHHEEMNEFKEQMA